MINHINKLRLGAVLFAIIAALSSMSVAASIWVIPISYTSTGSTPTITMAGLWLSMDNSGLASDHYISSNGLDVKMYDNSTQLPVMLTTTTTYFADAVQGNLNKIITYKTGNTAASSMAIIPGYGGYITTSDNAALELGNSFNIYYNGYVDLSAGGDANIWGKTDAWSIVNSNTNEITASINGGTSSITVCDIGASTKNIYGTSWYAQTFTTVGGGLLTSATAYMSAYGSPSGDFYAYIEETTAGLPNGNILATDLVNANTISAGDNTFTFSSPATVSSSTMYALVFAFPTGDSGHYINWNYNGSSVYADGTYCNSSDSGSSWSSVATREFRCAINISNIVSITSASTTGEHSYRLALTGGTLTLYDGAISLGSESFSGSITDNANDIILGSNATPYINYVKMEISSVEQLWYQPIAMISGTTLPDRDNSFNGAFTFGGSLPTDVTLTGGIMYSGNTSTPTVNTANSTPTVSVPINTREYATDIPTPATNPFDPYISQIAALSTSGGASGMDSSMIWGLIWAAIIFGGIIGAGKITSSLLIGGGAGLVLTAIAFKLGVFMWWMVVIYVLGYAALIIWERKPSL